MMNESLFKAVPQSQNATLGNERKCPVRLYENAGRDALECLRFLQEQHNLGRLIGLA